MPGSRWFTDINPATLVGKEGKRIAAEVYEDPRSYTFNELYELRPLIPFMLDFYEERLADLNPATIPFLRRDAKKREALQNELKTIWFYYFSAWKIENGRKKRDRLKTYEKQMAHCVALLDFLDSDENRLPNTDPKHVKYVGLRVLAEETVKKLMAALKEKKEYFLRRKTLTIREIIGSINSDRLYWVWGGGFLASVLALIPTTFYNTAGADKALGTTSQISGILGWTLYYTRLGVESLMVGLHTIKGPWMSQEEKNLEMGTWRRFITEFDEKKFILLNDFLWANINLICFFWLNGAGALGFAGNIISIALLVSDVVLATWAFLELYAGYAKKVKSIEARLRELEALPENEKHLYQQEIDELNDLLKHTKKEQALALTRQMATVLLAISLVVGFTIASVTLGHMSLVMAIVGLGICFLATTLHRVFVNSLEIYRFYKTHREALLQCNILLDAFKEIDEEIQNTDDEVKKQQLDVEKRLLYVQMKTCLAKSKFQKLRMSHQGIVLIRALIIDACLPVFVFTALVFLPLGVGLSILGVGIGFAVMSSILLKKLSPTQDKLPDFDEDDYLAFASLQPNEQTVKALTSRLPQPENEDAEDAKVEDEEGGEGEFLLPQNER